MKILFKYPTRSRRDWFQKTLVTYYNMVSDNCDFEFVITLNNDDESMNDAKIRTFMDKIVNLSYVYGDHKTKIDACNADIDLKKDWDILILVSDDMIPIVKGFDQIIVELMEKYFPDTDGALHFNDGYCGGKNTITYSIIGRKLYEKIGYVYHPSYKSFWCDCEFTDVVRKMKKYHYDERIIVKHVWSGGKNSKDPLYRRNTRMGEKDKSIYDTRKSRGFPR